MIHSQQPGDDHIWALDFPQWHEVTGRNSVADLHKPRERCGIYVLGFANGERYVGQAVDVVRRFSQHCKTHGDITSMTFKQVKQSELNGVERHCIHTLEAQGLRLRNISHMSVVQGERDLDLVVTPEEQEQWLTGDVAELQDAVQTVEDQDLRRRYQRRFQEFMALPEAHDALFLLGRYLQAVVPFPRRTELAFWAVSCLPDTGAVTEGRVLFRVNLNMQEVFTLVSGPDSLVGSFHLAQSPYREHLGEQWAEQLAEWNWGVDTHAYSPGGQDQFNLWTTGFENVMDLLMDWGHLEPMGLLNLRLMRRGATYYGRYHSLDLVDAAIEIYAAREHELEHWFEKREEQLMSFEPLPGLFHFAGGVFPASFNPRTWIVEASIDPQDRASIDLSHEYPATFESALRDGGAITGYSRLLNSDSADQFSLRLKSLIAEGEA